MSRQLTSIFPFADRVILLDRETIVLTLEVWCAEAATAMTLTCELLESAVKAFCAGTHLAFEKNP